jgi:dihydrodipicolinate synthase/N-acetylneuraminate lyase
VSNILRIFRFILSDPSHSALPVMIYNYPGASAGIDLDSDLLIELSEHQNCCGAKVRYFTARAAVGVK